MTWKFTLLCAVFLSSCQYSLHQYQVSDFEPYAAQGKGKVVTAEVERFVFLYFSSDTSYVDIAYRELGDACPKGHVTSIVAKHSTDLGFLSHKDHFRLKGLCYN
jgi:hypothetical protein